MEDKIVLDERILKRLLQVLREDQRPRSAEQWWYLLEQMRGHYVANNKRPV